jgi:hypothetical protein
MRKLITFVIAFIWSSITAYAGDGTIPIIVFPGGAGTTGNAILWTKSSNIQSPNICYDFAPTDNDTIPSHYTNNGTSYSYNPPPAPLVVHPNLADIKAFEVEIWADPNPVMTSAVKFMIAQNFPIMESNASNPQNLQAGWAGAVAAFGSTWLTTDVQTEVLTVAANNNVQLAP